MQSQINPRLRRTDVVLNSFASSVSNAPKELSWTPEMSLPEILSQPIMSLQKFESGIAFKQLKGFANTHSGWHFNKQMRMINSDMQFINAESVSISSFSDKTLAVNSNALKLEWIPSIFGLPNKMESILSKGMSCAFQVHFFTPANLTENLAHAKFAKFSSGAQQSPKYVNNFKELNIGDGNSSLCLKAEVSLPLM